MEWGIPTNFHGQAALAVGSDFVGNFVHTGVKDGALSQDSRANGVQVGEEGGL